MINTKENNIFYLSSIKEKLSKLPKTGLKRVSGLVDMWIVCHSFPHENPSFNIDGLFLHELKYSLNSLITTVLDTNTLVALVISLESISDKTAKTLVDFLLLPALKLLLSKTGSVSEQNGLLSKFACMGTLRKDRLVEHCLLDNNKRHFSERLPVLIRHLSDKKAVDRLAAEFCATTEGNGFTTLFLLAGERLANFHKTLLLRSMGNDKQAKRVLKVGLLLEEKNFLINLVEFLDEAKCCCLYEWATNIVLDHVCCSLVLKVLDKHLLKKSKGKTKDFVEELNRPCTTEEVMRELGRQNNFEVYSERTKRGLHRKVLFFKKESCSFRVAFYYSAVYFEEDKGWRRIAFKEFLEKITN